jgi:peptidoglycan/LPS O-acetylase OafA/YrhL
MASGVSAPIAAPPAADAAPKALPRFYHPEIDGLRFVAFAAVFAHHALPHTPLNAIARISPAIAAWIAAAARAGGFGVDLFFVLSAYLISELLLYEQTARGTIDVRSFYLRRALRIWPLYYAFLAFAVVVAPLVLPRQSLGGRDLAAFTFFGANWACALRGYPQSVAAPLWSVSIEEQFYLVWPLVLWLVPRAKLRWVAVAMIVIANLTRVGLALAGTRHPGVWCNTFARLDPIACGTLAALALHQRRFELAPAQRWLLGLAGVAAIVTVARYFDFEGSVWDPMVICPVVAAASVAILAATLAVDPQRRLLARAPMVYLGRISYGLYVFHAFGLALATSWITSSSPVVELLGRSGVALALTLALAAASYRWLERPFLRLKERFSHVASRPGG